MNAQPIRQHATAHCPHCGVQIDGTDDAFCCRGCEMAASIINDAGLSRYYETRTAPAPRPEPSRSDWSSVHIEPGRDGLSCALLAIDGLTCASCVWVVENVLQRTPGVSGAHVSYATGRAQIRFDPGAISLPEIGLRISRLGYQPRPVDAAPSSDRDLIVKLGVAAFCASNVMLLAASVYVGWGEGMDERYAALFRWASLALATPVALWSATPFYRSAWTALRSGVVHMDLPIGLAVGSLYVHGLFATLVGRDSYLDSLCMVVALLLAGRMVEARGRRAATAAAAAIAAALPTTARRVTEGGVETVSVSLLRPGDTVEVGLGEEVPADGSVIRGTAKLTLAMLTGESEPASVSVGDWVVAGAPVVDGAIAVTVERVAEETLGRRMAADVMSAMDRPLLPTPADRIAPWFVLFTIVAALLTGIGWTWAAGLGEGIEHLAAVLVVACPCALGLSWPVAVSAGTAALARRGVVLRSGDALARLSMVDTVALDKTGTVTGGTPDVLAADDEVLRIAAGLERASSHPIAAALRRAAAARHIPLPLATDIRESPGVGIEGTVDGERWSLSAGGPGEVRLHRDGFVGIITLRDQPRPDAAAVIHALSARAHVVMLTGDHESTAARLAEIVLPHAFFAKMSPQDKASWITDRRAAGHTVLFVGDGLNDGPALVAADVGLAMRAGAASSVLAADGVIVGGGADGLAPVLAALRVGRIVRAAVRFNLVSSAVYNVSAVVLAMAGLVNPLVAALLMPASSLLVLWGGSRVEQRLQREERWMSS